MDIGLYLIAGAIIVMLARWIYGKYTRTKITERELDYFEGDLFYQDLHEKIEAIMRNNTISRNELVEIWLPISEYADDLLRRNFPFFKSPETLTNKIKKKISSVK